MRTVLRDIDASELGETYAHERLVIVGGRPVELYPDILLDSLDRASAEIAPARLLGLQSVVDAMPADCGRDVSMFTASQSDDWPPHRGLDRTAHAALLPRTALEHPAGRGPIAIASPATPGELSPAWYYGPTSHVVWNRGYTLGPLWATFGS